ALLEGLGRQSHQLDEPLGEDDHLVDAVGAVAGGDGHQSSPCSLSISRATTSATPIPPAPDICRAMASVMNERNMASPGPPPNGAEVSTPANICCSMIERNCVSNCFAVSRISPRLASSAAPAAGGGRSREGGTTAAARS